MYTSTQDARSDLFLAAGVFLFGGVIVQAVLGLVPLDRIQVVGLLLRITLPLVTTVLVPFLLIRYRKEPWSHYGLARFTPSTFGLGVALAVPLAIAGVAVALLAGAAPGASVPLAGLAGAANGWEVVLSRVVRWLGYTLLAVYGTVKARDAFNGTHQALPAAARQIALILAGAVGVASVLLILSMAARGGLAAGGTVVAVERLLTALGVATAVVIMLGSLTRAGATTRPTLVTPAVLVGMVLIRGLRFDAVSLVTMVYFIGLLALLGLVVGLLQESRHTAWGAVGLGLGIAMLTNFV